VTRLTPSLLLLAILAWPGAARAEGLDQRVPAAPGGRLQIDLDLGEETRSGRVSLDVRSHDADEVYAVADLSGPGSASVTFRLEADDHGVRLYGRSEGLMSWIFGGPGVAVRVWVPREFSVDVRNSSGPVHVEDLIGRVRARTTDGRIEVSAVEGEVEIHTETGTVEVSEVQGPVTVRATQADVSLTWVEGETRVRIGGGDIRARHVEGPLQLRTDAGEVAIRDLRGRVDVKTERGAVYASFAGPPEGRIETQRGSVEVAIPEHAGVALDARTRHGTVEVADGLAFDGTPPRVDHCVGKINGGGAPLEIYSARGHIRVGRR
jgi:hypothetical protein